MIATDIDIRQQGTVSPHSNGGAKGFQAGTDLFATPNWRAGVYVGRLDGSVDLSGIASGTGATSSELAGGLTLALNQTTSVYGEVDKLWATGGDAKIKSTAQVSLGLRMKW